MKQKLKAIGRELLANLRWGYRVLCASTVVGCGLGFGFWAATWWLLG